MNKFLILIVVIFSNHVSYGQNNHKIFVTYGISNALPAYNHNGVAGGGGYDGTGSFSIGLRYFAKSNKPITFETGLDYATHKYDKSPAFYPGLDMAPKPEKLHLISVPLYANLTFWKYVFVHGGALVDFEINKQNSIQKQSGIGLGLGIGGKYDFKRFSVMVNPFLQRHAILAFEKTGTRLSLLNAGVRIGLGYSF